MKARDLFRFNPYFAWLCDFVEAERYRRVGVLWELYKIEYYSEISMDQNRISDGFDLRTRYLSTFNHDFCFPECNCTVLEMLIALYLRVSTDVLDGLDERFFWEMINNLGIFEGFDDRTIMYETGTDIQIRYAVDIFLDRKYERDGNLGIFPLKYPRKDQRKTEIWYQAMAYLEENYVK